MAAAAMTAAAHRVVGRARWARRIGDAEARLFGFPMAASLGRVGRRCCATERAWRSEPADRRSGRCRAACAVMPAPVTHGAVRLRRRSTARTRISEDLTTRQALFTQLPGLIAVITRICRRAFSASAVDDLLRLVPAGAQRGGGRPRLPRVVRPNRLQHLAPSNRQLVGSATSIQTTKRMSSATFRKERAHPPARKAIHRCHRQPIVVGVRRSDVACNVRVGAGDCQRLEGATPFDGRPRASHVERRSDMSRSCARLRSMLCPN